MRYLLVSILIIPILGSLALAGETKLTFDTTVETATPTFEGLTGRTSFAAGKDVPIDTDKVTWIEAKGRVPVLLVPAKDFRDADRSPKLKLPEVAAWPPQMIEQEIDRRMSTMIEDLQSFQTALVRRDLPEAETILTRLESTQPIPYLPFLRASLEFLKGNLKSARTNVERGLKKYPNNVQGQKLLRALEENKR